MTVQPKTGTDKSCGACRSCCIELKIDSKAFQKPAKELCAHHTGQGCGIYARRPKICREFLCGWRLFPELGEEWRPDRSGVLILQVAQEKLPFPYRAQGHGVQLLITDGTDAILRPAFVRYVAQLVERKIAVYLHSSAPEALANGHLDDVTAGDDKSLSAILVSLYRLLEAAQQRRSFLSMLPHLYRLNLEKRRARAKIMVNKNFKS